MKKFLKVLLITISSLILLYGVFVGVECLRLQNSFESKPPIITTQDAQIEDYSIKYTGLGYTVTYRLYEKPGLNEQESYSPLYDVCGAEFRFFDKIMLWAWIE